jgi:hypothetical protein
MTPQRRVHCRNEPGIELLGTIQDEKLGFRMKELG